MSKLFGLSSVGSGFWVPLAVACLTAAPDSATAQTPNPNKAKVTQAQSDQASAKADAIQGQCDLAKAQADLDKAKCAETAAEAKLAQATLDGPLKEKMLELLKVSTPKKPVPADPAKPTPDDLKKLEDWCKADAQWQAVTAAAQKAVDDSKKSLDDAKCAVVNAKADVISKTTAASVAQGVYNQLQKDQQKADSKVQQAIQGLLDSVQATPAPSTTKTGSLATFPLLRTALATPIYLGPSGTPMDFSQQQILNSPWNPSDPTQAYPTVQLVPPNCDPVPRVQVCDWTPRVLGATLVKTASLKTPVQPSQPNPGSDSSGPGDKVVSQTRAQSAPAVQPGPGSQNRSDTNDSSDSDDSYDPYDPKNSQDEWVLEDASSAPPRVTVISIDPDDIASNADLLKAHKDLQPLAMTFQRDYRFDLPARFPVAKFPPPDSCEPPFEAEGAVIHEGMRIRTTKEGRYQIRLNVTAPPTYVTMRLQLLLYDKSSSPFPKTLTLPPIRLEPTDDTDNDGIHDAVSPPSGGLIYQSYLVQVEGFSHVVKENDGKFLLARRTGTARFGAGVPLNQAGF